MHGSHFAGNVLLEAVRKQEGMEDAWPQAFQEQRKGLHIHSLRPIQKDFAVEIPERDEQLSERLIVLPLSTQAVNRILVHLQQSVE